MERQGLPGASRVAPGLAALVSSLASGAPLTHLVGCTAGVKARTPEDWVLSNYCIS
jgi:hypothetical protein